MSVISKFKMAAICAVINVLTSAQSRDWDMILMAISMFQGLWFIWIWLFRSRSCLSYLNSRWQSLCYHKLNRSIYLLWGEIEAWSSSLAAECERCPRHSPQPILQCKPCFLHEHLRVERPVLHLHVMTSSNTLAAEERWVMSGTNEHRWMDQPQCDVIISVLPLHTWTW